MNLPNKLTCCRIILVPFYLLFLLVHSIPLHFFWAEVIFGLAALTDFLDGRIARKNHLITNFGKFMDPLADKMLVVSGLIAMQALGICHPIIVVIIVAREFLVTSLRLVASDSGIVIAAGILGKIKTAYTMIAMAVIQLVLFLSELFPFPGFFSVTLFSEILLWIAALLTVWSGADYLIRNWAIVKETK